MTDHWIRDEGNQLVIFSVSNRNSFLLFNVSTRILWSKAYHSTSKRSKLSQTFQDSLALNLFRSRGFSVRLLILTCIMLKLKNLLIIFLWLNCHKSTSKLCSNLYEPPGICFSELEINPCVKNNNCRLLFSSTLLNLNIDFVSETSKILGRLKCSKVSINHHDVY